MGDHLIVMYSAVRGCAGYDRHETPSILLEGSSMARDTEHGRAVTAQLTRRHRTLEEAIDAGNFALSAAGVTRAVRRQARAACEDYFYNRLALRPSDELDGRAARVASLELLPDPIHYEALRLADEDQTLFIYSVEPGRPRSRRWRCATAGPARLHRRPLPEIARLTVRRGPTG